MSSLTSEIVLIFTILCLAVVLFATEWLRVDVAALLLLLLLSIAGLLPGVDPLLPYNAIFSGFSSNAVIAIIAVMIMSSGLEKSGILGQLAKYIMRWGRKSESHLLAFTGMTAGLTSSLMQNTGAAALYIPVVREIAAESRISARRLLLPMGFCAIVGGIITMIGSSPLILLNDLLPATIEPFGLFAIVPVGLALLLATILYFLIFQRWLLPTSNTNHAAAITSVKLPDTYSKRRWFAISCLLISIVLIFTTSLPLSVSLLMGAFLMVLTGVQSIDEAYAAINWRTIFLLASLIPVGTAVEHTGAANWLSQRLVILLSDISVEPILIIISIIATVFSLVLSNIGATVLLVPLVVNLAIQLGFDPRLFALTTAIMASNSFILPTHQVNVLISQAGDYSVNDFLRVGVGMTVLYPAVSLPILLWLF